MKIEKLKLLKYNGFAGNTAMQDFELTEINNEKIQASMLKRLKERVDNFFNKFL